MAQYKNQSSYSNAPLSAKTCDLKFLSCCHLYLHIIRKSKRSIRVMKYIPMCTSLRFLVGVSSTLLFILQCSLICVNSSSAAFSFRPLRLVLSAMYHFQSGYLDSCSLFWVKERLIRGCHCSGPVPRMLMMLMDCAISQMWSLTWLSIRCVVKPPWSC